MARPSRTALSRRLERLGYYLERSDPHSGPRDDAGRLYRWAVGQPPFVPSDGCNTLTEVAQYVERLETVGAQ